MSASTRRALLSCHDEVNGYNLVVNRGMFLSGIPQNSRRELNPPLTYRELPVRQVLFFGYDTLDKLLANTGSYSLPLLCFLCVAKVTYYMLLRLLLPSCCRCVAAVLFNSL